MPLFTLLVESDELLETKHKCHIEAMNLDELIQGLIASLKLDEKRLVIEVFDKEFEEFVALDAFALLNGMTKAKIRISRPKSAMKINDMSTRQCHSTAGTTMNIGTWTDEENKAFEEGLSRFGKDWKAIGPLIPTRNLTQIRSHAQKFFKKHKDHKLVERSAAASAAPAAEIFHFPESDIAAPLPPASGESDLQESGSRSGGHTRSNSSSSQQPPQAKKRHTRQRTPLFDTATSATAGMDGSIDGLGQVSLSQMEGLSGMSLSNLSLDGEMPVADLIKQRDSDIALNMSMSGGIVDESFSFLIQEDGNSIDLDNGGEGFDGKAKANVKPPLRLVSTTDTISEEQLVKLQRQINSTQTSSRSTKA